MECGSERIMFNSEWNYFCLRKDPIKQNPGERKGRKERGRESGEERKKRKGRERERKGNVSKDVVNYPIKQFSWKSKNRNSNSLSRILIAFDGLRTRKPIYTSQFRISGQHNKIIKKKKKKRKKEIEICHVICKNMDSRNIFFKKTLDFYK